MYCFSLDHVSVAFVHVTALLRESCKKFLKVALKSWTFVCYPNTTGESEFALLCYALPALTSRPQTEQRAIDLVFETCKNGYSHMHLVCAGTAHGSHRITQYTRLLNACLEALVLLSGSGFSYLEQALSSNITSNDFYCWLLAQDVWISMVCRN